MLLSAFFFVFSSQIAVSQDSLKTTSHSWTAELNVNPLQGQISLNNAVNQIKVRYFASNQFAYRLAFSVNNVKRDNDQKSTYGANPVNTSDVKKSTTLGLNFGFEKHLVGTRRLSPYIGGELALGLKNANAKYETTEGTTEIKGAWQDISYVSSGSSYYTSYITSEPGYKSIGLNIVAGFDFYIAKHFFFGYEMLFGFTYKKYQDIVRTYTPKPGKPTYNTTYPDQTGSERNFGPKIINGIRLGYTF